MFISIFKHYNLQHNEQHYNYDIKIPSLYTMDIPQVLGRALQDGTITESELAALNTPPSEFAVPADVRQAAETGNKMNELGFKGSTGTGINRGKQLATSKTVGVSTLADMRTWFARHGPDAKNGGTSYPNYKSWVAAGKPLDSGFSNYRGAKSWLLWGGDAAYLWLKQPEIRAAMKYYFPKRKEASTTNNLG